MLRRAHRDISIFNLSAIDLFCSGMGAVMVLMVLLMPYYRKQNPVPPEPEPVTAPAPVAEAPPETSPPDPPQPQPESRIETRGIDVVFVLDTTASMQNELQSLQNSMVSIIQVMRRLSDEPSVGFVAFIDRGVQKSIPLRPVSRSRQGDANTRELMRGIAQIQLIGNQVWPEDVCAGLENAAAMRWPPPTPDRRQIMIVIGDARTHPEDRLRSLSIVRDWVGQSRGARSVHAVFTMSRQWRNHPALRDEMPLSSQYFKDLAIVGNGEFHEGEEDLLGSILDIIIIR